MDYAGFVISSSIFTFFYSFSAVLLIWRMKSPSVIRRSPKLLLISLLGGLLQNIIIFHEIAFYPSEIVKNHKNYKQLLQTRQCFNVLAHILIVEPYLLRSYRLYFIFHLDKHWNDNKNFFTTHIHRSFQSWLLKIMAASLLVWVLVMVVIYTTDAGYYLPGSELALTQEQKNVSECLFVTSCFLEQLAFLISFYMLRNVFDDFNMVRELAWVAVLWVITPVFPFFEENEAYYQVSIVIRNSLLWIRSICIPIFFSFKEKVAIEVLTLEMIGSFEVILQSEIGLSYFQKFLKRHIVLKGGISDAEIDGFDALEVYMMIENFLVLEIEEEKQQIQRVIEKLGQFVPEIGFNKNLENFKNWLYLSLKTEFGKFKLSKEYDKMKREIAKQEIYIGRIMQTSMDKSIGSNKNSAMVSFT